MLNWCISMFLFFLPRGIQLMPFLVCQGSFGLSKGHPITESILLIGCIAGKVRSLLQYDLTEKSLTKLRAPTGMWQFLWNFQPHRMMQSMSTGLTFYCLSEIFRPATILVLFFHVWFAEVVKLDGTSTSSSRWRACAVALQSGVTVEKNKQYFILSFGDSKGLPHCVWKQELLRKKVTQKIC